MIQLDVKNIFGEVSNPTTFEFPEELISMKCTDRSIQTVYLVDLSNRKGSFASTKDRGEVSGTTKKMYRQKGTGGARHGSARVGQFRGGGVIFGPKFSERRIRINKKLRSLAVLTCLNKHVARGSLMLLDSLDSENLKTKKTFEHLSRFFSQELNQQYSETKSFMLKTGCLFVDMKSGGTSRSNFAISSRNLPGVKCVMDASINVTDLLRHGVVFVTLDAMRKIIALFYEKFSLVKQSV